MAKRGKGDPWRLPVNPEGSALSKIKFLPNEQLTVDPRRIAEAEAEIRERQKPFFTHIDAHTLDKVLR